MGFINCLCFSLYYISYHIFLNVFLQVILLYLNKAQCKTIDPPTLKTGSITTPVLQFASCSKGKKFPHPENINKYFECQFISKADVWLTQPLNCPPGEIFNNSKQSCSNKEGTGKDDMEGIRGEGRFDVSPKEMKVSPSNNNKSSVPIINNSNIQLVPKNNSQQESIGLLFKMAASIDTLALIVQKLVHTNENLVQNALEDNAKLKTARIENNEFKTNNSKNESINNTSNFTIINNNALNTTTKTTQSSYSSIPSNHVVNEISVQQQRPHKIIIEHSEEKEKSPVKEDPDDEDDNNDNMEFEYEDDKEVNTDNSADATNNNNNSSTEQQTENSFFKVFLQSLLPKQVISVIPTLPSPIISRHEFIEIPKHQAKATTTSPIPTTSTARSTNSNGNIVFSSIRPHYIFNQLLPNPQNGTVNKLQAYEFHHLPQTTAQSPIITQIIPSSTKDRHGMNNLLNLMSLFRHFSRRRFGVASSAEEDNSSSQESGNNGLLHSIATFSHPHSNLQKIIHSSNNKPNNNVSSNPFIFQRIPMSSSSAAVENRPFLQNNPQLINNRLDKSNIREPRRY